MCFLPTSFLHLNDFFHLVLFKDLFEKQNLAFNLTFCNKNKIDTMVGQLKSKSFLFFFRDLLRSTLGITCGRGSFAVSGSFTVGDHMRYCTVV